MSDPIKPVPTSPPHASAPKGQIVPVQTLPDALRSVSRALRLEGEVVGQNRDGSTRIRTSQGDIDVTLRGKQLQPGTKVEIDIPTGNPPRNVTVRPAPAQAPAAPAPLPQTPQTPQTQPPVTAEPRPATPQAPPQTGTITPAPRPAPEAAQPMPPASAPPPVLETKPAPALPQLPPLKPGDTVTLVPLPADAVLPDAPDKVVQDRTQAQMQQTAQKAQSSLLSSLVQAVKTVLPDNSPALQTVNALLTGQEKPSAPIPAQSGATGAPAPVTPIILTLSAKVVALTLPSGQTLSVQNTPPTAIPQSAVQTPLPAAPVAVPLPLVPAATTPGITPPAFTITVEQVTAQNQPVIPVITNNAGAVQNFVLQSPPATVPVGTQITLQPQLPSASTPAIPTNAVTAGPMMQAPAMLQTTPAPQALPPQWRALLPLMQPSSLWPVLDEVFQSFYQATPQAAQILARTIPSPANPASFGPSALLFAAALKAGDLQGWIGEKKLDMIHKLGKADLVSRLSSETASLAGNTDTPATEWKSFPVPMLWQNEISKVLFHVRREPDENNSDNAETGTRFVMDLSLTRMGAVQLDGLVRGHRLDLVVRTEMPISAAMQEAMKKAYADALDGSSIYGELGFQGDLKHMLQVLKREDAMSASA